MVGDTVGPFDGEGDGAGESDGLPVGKKGIADMPKGGLETTPSSCVTIVGRKVLVGSGVILGMGVVGTMTDSVPCLV